MSDGTMVLTTPLEWRSRMRAVAQARSVSFHENASGRRLLQLRQDLMPIRRYSGSSVSVNASDTSSVRSPNSSSGNLSM